MKAYKTQKVIIKKRGFTLVELMIYMGLFGILMWILTDIFLTTLDAQAEVSSISVVEQDSQAIMNRLSFDAMRATAVVVPLTLGGTGASAEFTVNGNSYTYLLNGDNLQIVVNGNPGQNLNSSESIINNLSFTRLGNVGGRDTLQVSFTVTSRQLRNGRPESINFRTVIGLRQN